jgi:hypothetical protein
MHGVSDRAGSPAPRMAARVVWPSAFLDGVGTPEYPPLSRRAVNFAAQYPAYAFPCQRFSPVLPDDTA